jgi:hypothetical protein
VLIPLKGRETGAQPETLKPCNLAPLKPET